MSNIRLDNTFPHKQSDVSKEPNGGRLSFETQDCSTTEFECIRFLQHQSFLKDKIFFLFLPRKIEIGKEYKFKEMRAVTQTSFGKPLLGKRMETPFVQVILWQVIDGAEKPITLTVESKRGVVYLDGLDFWAGKFNYGETCFLQSSTGFFPKVEVRKNNEPTKINVSAQSSPR